MMAILKLKMREALIDRMFSESKKSLYFTTREAFAKSLDDYDLSPMYQDGKMYAVVVSKGPEFHFMVMGEKWTLNKEILEEYPGSLIRRFGYAETFTPVEDERQHRFNKRLGFVETRRDENNVYYKIERMRTCQQSPV